MCGRYVLATPAPEIATYFSASFSPEIAEILRPSWNVPPTISVPAITGNLSGARAMRLYRWGLVPPWAKGLSFGARAINARAESIATKPSFRSAFKSHRCVIPADGYFEWKTTPGEVRQPYYFTRSDGAPLAFAGLFELWRPADTDGPDQPAVATCAIVTTESGADVEEIHTRMPVVLDEEMIDAWIDPRERDRDFLESLLVPAAKGTLDRRRVGRAVGNVKNDSCDLIKELSESPSLF